MVVDDGNTVGIADRPILEHRTMSWHWHIAKLPNELCPNLCRQDGTFLTLGDC